MRNDVVKGQQLYQIIEQQVRSYPQAPAVRFDEEILTYDELNRRANKLARYLRRLGVDGPGQIIGTAVPRSVDMIVSILAILKLGAAYLPLDPEYPKSRLDHMLSDSGATFVISKERQRTGFNAACKMIDLDPESADALQIQLEDEKNLSPSGTLDDLAYVIYTSGSTGLPKGAEITHRNIENFVLAMRQPFPMAVGDVLLAVASLSFDLSIFDIFLPLCNGACVSVAPKSLLADPARTFAKIESENITYMGATPSTFKLLLDSGLPDIKKIKLMLGGEAIPQDLAERLLTKVGELWFAYGPTEATVLCTTVRYTGGKVYLGPAILNTQVFVMTPEGSLCPPGVVGEICIEGRGVGRGYRNRPELTSEKFKEAVTPSGVTCRVYRTGDLGCFDTNRNLEFRGRIDHQVKIRGYRIEIGEIENQIRRHPSILDAVVVPFKDTTGADSLAAYYVEKPAGESGLTHVPSLRSFLRENLPEFMVPAVLMRLLELPLDQNLKVSRRLLPPPVSTVEASTNLTLPRNDTERRISEIWSSALNQDPIDIYSNFFEIGGHSLMAVVLTMELEEAFGMVVPLDVLWAEGSTIAGLANLVSDSGKLAEKSRLVLLKAGKPEDAPLFVMHTVRGAVNEYQAFSSYLPANVTVIGVRAKGVFGDDMPEPDLSIYARDCIEAIRKDYPNGPYRLAGYSMGGLIAFEMALQLRKMNFKVEFLGLIDTPAPDYVLKTDIRKVIERKIARASLRIKHILPRGSRTAARSSVLPISVWNPIEAGSNTDLMTAKTRERFESMMLAESTYSPTSVCDVPLDVFVCDFASRADRVAMLGWQPLAGAGASVHVLKAPTHAEVMTPTYASDLAAAMQASLTHRIGL